MSTVSPEDARITGKYLLTQHPYICVEYRRDQSTQSRVFEKSGASAQERQDIAGFEFTLPVHLTEGGARRRVHHLPPGRGSAPF